MINQSNSVFTDVDNSNAPVKIKLPYARFSLAQQQLANIEAIDYFFAKQFTEQLLLAAYKKQAELLKDTAIEKDQTIERDKLAISHQQLAVHSSLIFHLLMALNMSLRAGHSCLPIEAIAGQQFALQCDAQGIVTHQGYGFPSIDVISNVLTLLALSEQDQQAIIVANDNIYLRRYYVFEQQIIEFIGQARAVNATQNTTQNTVQNPDNTAIKQCLDKLFPETQPLDNAINDEKDMEVDWQKIAVANALNKSFSIIAGGPGTGKTYTVTKLLAALVMLNAHKPLTMALVAPTGKAAQRLSESIIQAVQGFRDLIAEQVLSQIPTQAQTIHRLLGVIPHSPNFKHHQDNKLAIDVLLVDEVSMVDLPLMSRIVRALPAHCRVILLGDADQLPSVAAGSVLSDLTPIKQAQYSSENKRYLSEVTGFKMLGVSKKAPMDHLTYLTKSRRFDGKGGIGLLAAAVINGEAEKSWQLLEQAQHETHSHSHSHLHSHLQSQLSLLTDNSQDWFSQLVEQYYRPLMQATSIEQAFALLGQFRFLSATRQGDSGVEQLNLRAEQILSPNQTHISAKNSFTSGLNSMTRSNLYHAKPIMINENDYSLGLYNGDVGFIWQNEAGHLMAVFETQDKQFKHILPSRLPQFESVYAMTIHKTQGSEFAHVAMVLPTTTDNQLLTRELLYTGITRAKQQLSIHSIKPVWFHGVESKISRYSGIEL